jgi:hypothetical protein
MGFPSPGDFMTISFTGGFRDWDSSFTRVSGFPFSPWVLHGFLLFQEESREASYQGDRGTPGLPLLQNEGKSGASFFMKKTIDFPPSPGDWLPLPPGRLQGFSFARGTT